MKKVLLSSCILLSTFTTEQAFACSSCGSSATSPLILKLDESFKMYFGLSENFGYVNYGIRGGSATKRWSDPSILTKTTAKLGLGIRTSENSFVTLVGAFVRNEGPVNSSDRTAGLKTKFLLGDPIASGRYNLVNMSMDNEFVPQIQLVASYKPNVAKNMVDNDGDAVDTTGNGFHQISPGIDMWWGMPTIQFGISQFLTYSFERKPDVQVTIANTPATVTKRTRNLQYTTVLAVGHSFKEQNFNLQSGLILDYIGKETTYRRYSDNSSDSVSVSSVQSNTAFATIDWYLTHVDMLRFSFTLGGLYNGNLGVFTNSRQTTSNSAVVAYERTFF